MHSPYSSLPSLDVSSLKWGLPILSNKQRITWHKASIQDLKISRIHTFHLFAILFICLLRQPYPKLTDVPYSPPSPLAATCFQPGVSHCMVTTLQPSKAPVWDFPSFHKPPPSFLISSSFALAWVWIREGRLVSFCRTSKAWQRITFQCNMLLYVYNIKSQEKRTCLWLFIHN